MFELILPGLIVAIINIFVMYHFFKQHLIWWETIPPIVLSVIIGLIVKLTAETTITRDYEYHGGWAVKVENQRAWTEWYTVTVTDYCTKDGKRVACGSHTETRYRHHPETWTLTDSNDYEIYIDDLHYRELKDLWGNEVEEVGHSRDYHRSSGDGRLFHCSWNHLDATFMPVTTRHSYENRVQASKKSLFHFVELNESEIKDYGLYELPEIYSYYKMLYISGNGPSYMQASKKLENLNAALGRKKQVQMRILVFQNQPVEAGLRQESYWQGGNKNEFTVCIGVDKDYNVKWSHVISWTEEELLKIKVRDQVRSMGKLDLEKVVDNMATEVEKSFVRKSFKDFSYIQIDIPNWVSILSFFLCVLVTVGIDYWAIINEFDENGSYRYNRYRSFR